MRELFDGTPKTYNRVMQHVQRWHNTAAAADEYQGYRDTFFQEKPPLQAPSTDFVPPSEIAYHSPYANEYYLACGVDIVPKCRLVARYQNYFVSMFFDVATITIAHETHTGTGMGGLIIADIEPILRALVEQRRKLTESERRRLHELEQMIPADRAMTMVATILAIIKRHVHDVATLAAIQEDFRNLLIYTTDRDDPGFDDAGD